MDASRMKQLRKSKGLTQQQAAVELGFSTQQRYNFYETGKREPDNETLKQIAEFFNVSTDYLLGNTDDPTPPADKKKDPIKDEDLKVAFWGRPDVSDKQLEKLREIAMILEGEDDDIN